MLEVLRQNSRNAIIYVLFGVIIAVFVINFGPGSQGCETTGPGKNFAARVGGQLIADTEFRYAYIVQGFSQAPVNVARAQRLKERTMDKLIEREVLAQEAERLGYDVAEDEVVGMMAEEGKMFILGVPTRTTDFQKDGQFDFERFRNLAQNRFGLSTARFVEVQRREVLADRMRRLLLAGTKVTPDEVKEDYDRRGLQINLEYVRFAPQAYENDVPVTPAEIDEYRKSHEKEIQKHYEDRPYLYKKTDRQVRLRRILIKAPREASDDDAAKARAKIDDATKRIQEGADFATVAREVSEDPTRGRGGDLGWRRKGFTALGEVIETKVLAAKAGDLIGPDRGDRGYELLKVEGFREGDLKLDEVAAEIAEEKLRLERAGASAKADAQALVARVRGGAKLEEVAPKAAPGDEGAKAGVQETGLFPRRGDAIPELGLLGPLVRAAFDSKEGDLLGPFDQRGAAVVARVKERKEPDREYFDKHKDEERRNAERQKWAETIESWTKQRCLAVRDEGRIRANEELLTYDGSKVGESQYQPCVGARSLESLLGAQ